MQLTIITDDSPGPLALIQQQLAEQGIQVPMLIGKCYTTPYFLDYIARQIATGAQAIIADQCTAQQLKAVREKLESRHWSGLPDDLVIYLRCRSEFNRNGARQ